jgi:hypothetical protein
MRKARFANAVSSARPIIVTETKGKFGGKNRGLRSDGTENLHKVFKHHRHRRLMGHAMV